MDAVCLSHFNGNRNMKKYRWKNGNDGFRNAQIIKLFHTLQAQKKYLNFN